MFFKKLFELLKAFREDEVFKQFQVSLLTPQPQPKPQQLSVGLVSFEAPQQTWGALRKRGVVAVVLSEQLGDDMANVYDSYIQRAHGLVKRHFDICELTDVDFVSFPAQKLIFIYLGMRVEWLE